MSTASFRGLLKSRFVFAWTMLSVLAGVAGFMALPAAFEPASRGLAALLLILCLVPYGCAVGSYSAWQAAPLRPRLVWFAAMALVVPLVLNRFGSGGFSYSELGLLLYALPFLMLGWGSFLGLPPFGVTLLILWLWLPVELGFFDHIIRWPEHQGGLFAIVLAMSWAITVLTPMNAKWRKLFDLSSYAPSKVFLGALKETGIFIAIGLPFGFATGFITWEPSLEKLALFPVTVLGVFWLTALPEEWLFRVLMTSNVEAYGLSKTPARMVISLVFGLSHLNNGPTPDWRYAVLATVAGWFYSRALVGPGGFMAAALTHAFVDSLWVTCFRSPTH